MANPQTYDDQGNPLNWRSDDAIEGYLAGADNRLAVRGAPDLPFNNGAGGTRKVGFTLHKGNTVLRSFAFNLNPQSIQRVDTSRTQLFATKGAFYVDDFGAGPTQITMTQLIASGDTVQTTGGGLARATMRQHFLDFYQHLYLPAVQASYSSTPLKVYFHDDHLYDTSFSRSPEAVYFGQQSLQLMRAVSLHNVWQAIITMTTLTVTNPNLGGVPQVAKVQYVVRAGDTLKKIAVRLAGRNASDKRVLAVEQKIIALNRGTRDDIATTRTISFYTPGGNTPRLETQTIKPLRLVAGEVIWIPASS